MAKKSLLLCWTQPSLSEVRQRTVPYVSLELPHTVCRFCAIKSASSIGWRGEVLAGIHLYGSTGVFRFRHRVVEGLVLTKPVYMATISQQVETTCLGNVYFFLINTKAPHGQAMALCGLCIYVRAREHQHRHSISLLQRFMRPQ